jgi:hypothetical protein
VSRRASGSSVRRTTPTGSVRSTRVLIPASSNGARVRATSTRPARRPVVGSAKSASLMRTSTPGWRSWNAAARRAPACSALSARVPIVIVAAPAAAATRMRSRSACASRVRASS